MTRAGWLSCVLAAMVLCASPLAAQPAAPALTVVSSGPSGALASLDQANEVRIVFSEPMVTLGRIPAVVTAPFVRITPAVPGSFRWSGTTMLIYTPDPKQPLPFATTYTVTGMTCAHCVNAVTQELSGIAGVETVDVDLATGSVTVVSAAGLDVSAVRDAVDEAGYTLTGP